MNDMSTGVFESVAGDVVTEANKLASMAKTSVAAASPTVVADTTVAVAQLQVEATKLGMSVVSHNTVLLHKILSYLVTALAGGGATGTLMRYFGL